MKHVIKNANSILYYVLHSKMCLQMAEFQVLFISQLTGKRGIRWQLQSAMVGYIRLRLINESKCSFVCSTATRNFCTHGVANIYDRGDLPHTSEHAFLGMASTSLLEIDIFSIGCMFFLCLNFGSPSDSTRPMCLMW